MKFLIPAKSGSSRCFNKNWRPFHNGKSLVETKIEQLLEVCDGSDIFVSCEDDARRSIVEKAGANFLLRDEAYSNDETHWSDVVARLVQSVPCDPDEDIAWVLATTPLFDDHADVLADWQHVQGEYDCILAVKPFQHYIIDAAGRPVNFQYGRWHEWSQDLPRWYLLCHPIHIMKKETYLRCNYYIGTRPFLYEIDGPAIDIDHPDEFEVAQALFSKKQSRRQNAKDDQSNQLLGAR